MGSWRSTFAVFLTCTALSSCVADDSAAPEDELAVDGRVVDDLTNDEISGASVIFVSDTLDVTDTRSDGDGRFSMVVSVRKGVRFGTLHAEHTGYEPSPEQTLYFDGTARSVELRLRARGD